MGEAIEISTTTATRADAERIAAALVERRLAACVQVNGPITSCYRWQGAIETAQEWLCTVKTTRPAYEQVEQAIRQLHPYDEPEIIAVPIVAGSEGYLTWLEQQVSDIPPKDTFGERCGVSPPVQQARNVPPKDTFEARIQIRPAEAAKGESVELRGAVYRPLVIHPAMLAAAVFPVTFEQAEAALAALPRLFIEPDGSFVWVADDAQGSWQIDGHLYDRNGRLLYVEVKGRCPAAAFDHLLHALSWPDVPLMFQLVREAVYLDEADFRRYAGI